MRAILAALAAFVLVHAVALLAASSASGAGEVAPPSPFDLAAARIVTRSNGRTPAECRPKSAEDLLLLPEAKRPVQRFMADRRASPRSMVSYQRRLRLAQDYLARVGFEHGDRTTPIEEFP